MPLTGLPCYQLRNLAFAYIKARFEMPWLYGMVGLFTTFQLPAPVGHNSQLSTLYLAQKGATLQYVINEVRDFTANLMTEVCHNVAIEPHLQPLTGESLHGASSITQNGARLDVAADGFWGSRFERAFFENVKRRAYDQRTREIEHGIFSPLVFSCTGGMGRAASTTYKRLVALIAGKRDEPYSTTLGWIRCRLSYSLLRAAIMCIIGARSTFGHATKVPEAPINLVSSDGHVPSLE